MISNLTERLKKIITDISDSPVRLLRFSLNNALGPYLKDELEQSQFGLQLAKGSVNIENLELNEKVLNHKLNGAVPFKILSAKLGTLKMDIPWKNVATDNIKVLVQNVVVSLCFSQGKNEDFAWTMETEKSMETSLQSSLILERSLEEEYSSEGLPDEGSGVQSMTQMFSHIFENMNISFENITVYIQNEENDKLKLFIKSMNFSNPQPEKLVKKVEDLWHKRLAKFTGARIDVESPESCKGEILNVPNENSIEISFQKTETDNLKSVRASANFSEECITAQVSSTQIKFFKQFFSHFEPEGRHDMSSSIYGDLNSSLSDSALFKSCLDVAPDHLEDSEELARSIVYCVAPTTPNPSAPVDSLNFQVKLNFRHFSLSLRGVSNFLLDLRSLSLVFQKDTVQLAIDDLQLSEITGINDIKTLISFEEQNQPRSRARDPSLKLNVHFSNQEHMVDVKLNVNPIKICCLPQSFTNLLSLFQSGTSSSSTHGNSDENQADRFQLKCPQIHLIVDFPSDFSNQGTCRLEAEMKGFELSDRPTSKTSFWAIQFESLEVYLTVNGERNCVGKVWTDDLDDNPRVEIQLQSDALLLSDKPRIIPSLMINLEKTFSSPLFLAIQSSNIKAMAPLNSDGNLDLDKTKQISRSIVELVLPCVRVDLSQFEYPIWANILSLVSGPATSSSCVLLSARRGTLKLRETLPRFIDDDYQMEKFRLDFEELKYFQGTIVKGKNVGNFHLINGRVLKLVDSDNNTLITKTPSPLRMDEIFCPPFAVSFRKLALKFSATEIISEGISFSCKPAPWALFVSLLSSPNKSSEPVPPADHPPAPPLSLDIQGEGLSIYYQPTTPASIGTFLIPARCFLTVGLIKYPVDPLLPHLQADDLQIWLKEDLHYLKNSETFLDLCHPDLNKHFESKCLVSVVNLSAFEIFLSRNLFDLFGSEAPPFEVLVNFPKREPENRLRVTLRSDSCETLIRCSKFLAKDISLLTVGTSDKIEQKTAPPPSRAVHVVSNPSPLKEEKPAVSHPHRIVKISSEESSPLSPPFAVEIPPPQVNFQKPDKQEILFDDPPPQKKEKDKVTSLKSGFVLFDEYEDALETFPSNRTSSPKLDEDEWEFVDSNSEMQAPDEHENFPNFLTASTIKVCHLSLSIKMFGGHDWDEQFQKSRAESSRFRYSKSNVMESQKDHIEILAEIPNVSFDSFTPGQTSEWRLTLEIRKLFVDDHVMDSKIQKFLTFRSVNHQFGHFADSNLKTPPNVMLVVELTSQKSYKFKLTLMPLRFYIDQDTLTFLCEFISRGFSSDASEETQAPYPTMDTGDDILFELFEISSIDTLVDYKPKHTFSTFRFRDSMYGLKSVELNKAPISLAAIKLRNVRDKDDLGEHLAKIWLGGLTNFSTIKNYLFGTKIGIPVQFAINIGAGVVDLIRHPVEEYNRGGNVLRGIGAGGLSLAQKVSVEVLNLAVKGTIVTQKLLDSVGTVIRGETPQPRPSLYANQPRNIDEGMRRGVANLMKGNLFGAFGAALLGALNTLQPERHEEALEKYKEDIERD